jgi:uncharacterized membrane protein
MDAVHLHLISNHVPILGALFGILVLIYGMLRKSPPTIAAAYIVFIVSALVGLAAYFSGEGAEEAVENLPGVTHDIVEAHEDVALYTLIAFVILAGVSLLGFLRSKNHYDRIKGWAIITLAVAIISFSIGTYTGLTGGQIRHTELRAVDGTNITTEPQQEHDD